MTAIQNAAKPGDFHRAYATSVRSFWHYFSADHALADMANEKYFRTVQGNIQAGDLIHAIDKDDQEAVFRIQYVDTELNEVGIAIERIVQYEPCTESGYQIRHVGSRGRGSRYQIVDPQGKVVDGYDNLVGKKTAERALAEVEENVTRPDAA